MLLSVTSIFTRWSELSGVNPGQMNRASTASVLPKMGMWMGLAGKNNFLTEILSEKCHILMHWLLVAGSRLNRFICFFAGLLLEFPDYSSVPCILVLKSPML